MRFTKRRKAARKRPLQLFAIAICCISFAYTCKYYKYSSTNSSNRNALWNGEALAFQSNNNPSSISIITGESNKKNINVNVNVNTLEIAMAYCNADITWLTDIITRELYLYNPRIRKVTLTILSKCGNHISIAAFLEETLTITKNSLDSALKIQVHIDELPNKGGCDLAFIHFINEYYKRETIDTASSSSILFLKDTPRTKKNCHQKGKYRTIQEMIQYIDTDTNTYESINQHAQSKSGFICGVKPTCGRSAYHDTAVLKTFAKYGYKRHGDAMAAVGTDNFNPANYISLNDFITRELQWRFPNDVVTEVCYGGSFGVAASRLFADSNLHVDSLLHADSHADSHVGREKDFRRLEEILREGPAMSVVEHFAERLWASFLAKPLDSFDTEVVLHSANGMQQEQERYMGTLLHSSMFRCFFGD
jgi:hypothetical protein